MPSVAARVTAQQTFSYVPHTSATGDTWQYVKAGTTTSAGASDGTTLIDTNGDSGGADTYNGRYWVHIRSGALMNRWKRIVDDNGSGTLTFESNGFEAQVASGVYYEIWLSPEPVVVVDSSSGSTDMVDAERTESSGFWGNYWAIPISGSRRGERAQVSTFSSGTFVLGSGLGGALSAGDVVVLRKFVEISNPNDGTTETLEQRRQNRVNFAVGDGFVGPRGGTFSFETDLYGSNFLATAGVASGSNILNGLFASCGYDEYRQTTRAVSGSSSTTTSVDITTGGWESYVIGAPVVWNGNLRWVTGFADGGGSADTVTVTPPFPSAPQAGDLLHGGRLYARSVTGDTYGVMFEWEVDGIRQIMTGCKGNVSINDGAKVTMAWSFNVDHWIEEVESLTIGAGLYVNDKPMLSHDRHVYQDTTAIDISGFTASLNAEHTAKTVQGANGINGRAGFHMTNQAAGATFRQLATNSGDSRAMSLAFDARTAFAFSISWGSHGEACGVRIPTARIKERVKREDASGLQAVAVVLQAQASGQYTDPSGTLQKIPDFAIGIM